MTIGSSGIARPARQVTFMKEQRKAGGGFVAVPWSGEIVEQMQRGARIRFRGSDGEEREYYVPQEDIV